MHAFLGMLRAKAFDINDVAAEELYKLTLRMLPGPERRTIEGEANQLEKDSDRPVSVPDSELHTPFDDGPLCQKGDCDYWLDDVFDVGAG
jgi:hypothetical protein